MTIAQEPIGDLVTQLNGIRTAVRSIEQHLRDAERALFSLMEQQGVAGRYPGVTKPEERGT